MTNSRPSKGRGRSSRATMRNVTVRTPSQAFEAQLSNRSDRSRLLGKTFVSTGSSAVVFGLNVNPSLLGARPSAYSTIFLRWKINRLIIKPLLLPLTGSGSVVGIMDDTVLSADIPTSLAGVLNLRCSVSYPANQIAYENYNDFEWRPSRGPPKWFFTTLEGSSSDPRLEVPCSIWFAQPGGTLVAPNFQIDYDISFEGAVDTLST